MSKRISKDMAITLVLLSVAALYTIAPILIALLGYFLQHLLGCEILMTSQSTCLGQAWLGDLVMGMFFIHWFGLLTIPTGLPICIALIVVLIIQAFRSSKH